MSATKWHEIKVFLPSQYGEIVAEIFFEAGINGVAYEDPEIIQDLELQYDEIIDNDLVARLEKSYAVKGYIPVADFSEAFLINLQEKIARVLNYLPEIKLSLSDEQDWADAWKAYYKPQYFQKVIIKPTWEDCPAEIDPEKVIVDLDPGMAFGTGTHPSTRLSIRLLEEIVDAQTRVLDIGTGSGLLAIIAAKLGATQIVATDLDPLAVRIAEANINLNQTGNLISVRQADLLDLKLESKFNLVISNIIAEVISKLIPDLERVLTKPGFYIASGIIAERYPNIEAALKKAGFKIKKKLTEAGWVGVLAELN